MIRQSRLDRYHEVPVRSPSADYLEAAKLEELAVDLERRGYRVARDAQVGDQFVDLLAERGEERLAFEIKARSRLQASTQDVVQLREAARDAGLTELRLIVVNPPHAVDVSIEDLHSELLRYFSENELPKELLALSPGARVEGVSDIDTESVEIRRARIHVRGRATADIEFNDARGGVRDGLTASDSFQFSFDLELGPDLRIAQMKHLSIDTEG